MDHYKHLFQNLMVSFFIFCTTISISNATIYRWQDKDGSVVFSDKAHDGAERVSLPPVTVLPTLHNSSSGDPSLPANQHTRSVNYQVNITSPQAGQTFVRGMEPVNFSVQTDQALQNGDRLYLYMNGNLIGEGYTTSIDTTNLDRGEYSLTARVVNANNQPASNEAKSSFNVFQRSALNGKKGR